jgi:hypothetical protein
MKKRISSSKNENDDEKSAVSKKGLAQKGLLEICANGVARLQRSREVIERDARAHVVRRHEANSNHTPAPDCIGIPIQLRSPSPSASPNIQAPACE